MLSHISTVQVSGSIVAYQNTAGQLLSAANGFLANSLRCHLTIIDNSPSDDLRQVVASLGADYLFSGSNLGFGAGHNMAIRRYEGISQYHLILNPDAYFDPEVLNNLYDFMQAHPDVGLIMPRVLLPDGTEQDVCRRLPTPIDLFGRRFAGALRNRIFRERMDRYVLRGVDLSKPRTVPSLSGCFMLAKTNVFCDVGGFDERYFLYMEDIDLCRRIGEVAETVFYPYAAIYHEYGAGSYRSRSMMKHHLRSAWKYFRKWGWFIDRGRDRLNGRGTRAV